MQIEALKYPRGHPVFRLEPEANIKSKWVFSPPPKTKIKKITSCMLDYRYNFLHIRLIKTYCIAVPE